MIEAHWLARSVTFWIHDDLLKNTVVRSNKTESRLFICQAVKTADLTNSCN